MAIKASGHDSYFVNSLFCSNKDVAIKVVVHLISWKRYLLPRRTLYNIKVGICDKGKERKVPKAAAWRCSMNRFCKVYMKTQVLSC